LFIVHSTLARFPALIGSQDAMATYFFTDVAGTSLVFVPAEDLLILPFGVSAAALRFASDSGDLLLSVAPDTVRLVGIGLGGSGLNASNLAFQDASLVFLDGTGTSVRTGSEFGDWIGIDRGGDDRIFAAGGDDYIRGGSGLGATDTVDGGEGTGDLLFLAGTLSVTFGPLTVTGIERFEIGAGTVSLTLDAATVATATPAAGALFTIDGSAQGTALNLSVDARGVSAAGVALLAAGGDDSLAGGFAADSIIGGAGDDTLDGFWGDDTIAGGAGIDILTGGLGSDLFLFDVAGVANSPPATPDLITDFEGAGTAGGDRIGLPGVAAIGLGLTFFVGGADFVFEGYDGSGVQLPAARIGDGYADVLWRLVENAAWRFEVWADLNDDGRFTPGDLFLRIAVPPGNTATSLAPGDFLAAFAGLVGGPGNDVFAGPGATDDLFWGEGGNDILSGGDGVDVLEGGLGGDSLYGGSLADELRGGPGSDWLEGGDGWDTLFAADNLSPETESADDRNRLAGGAGRDVLFGGAGLDTLLGEADDDLLWGDEGADSLLGGDGIDLVYGREGDDVLDGGAGDDTLLGGTGGDTFTGGDGADLFFIDLSTDGQAEATGAAPDWITDFNAAEGDVLSLALVGGLVGGALGPGPLAWRGTLAPRDLSLGVGLGSVLPGAGLGPGYYQSWFLPAVSGGQAAGGWFIVDLDQDLVIGADDAIIRIGSLARPGALTPEDFAEGTFRVRVGTAGADVLLAAAAGQEMFGLAGADRLTARNGADRLVGGEGDDTLLGAQGIDQLWGGAGNDSLDGGADGDELFVEGPDLAEQDGIFARNTLAGGDGDDSLWGADGRDSLDGGIGADWLYGGVGLDTLAGGDGADTIQGGDGADLIEGGTGADSIIAGAGDDTVDYDLADAFADGGDDLDLLVIRAAVSITLDSSIDQVAGGGITRGFEGVDGSAVTVALTLAGSSGRNRLIGGSGDDRIDGRDANDSLEGGAGSDTLDGGTGDDVVIGGPGGDSLLGGSGFDLVSYADATVGVTVGLVTGGAGDTLSGFESLRGSGFADRLTGTDDANRLEGLAGDDTLDGRLGDDTMLGAAGRDSILGGGGADSLLGGSDADTLGGGDGNDVLDGGEAADRLVGGAGNDLYFVDLRGDAVFETAGAGDDTVVATGSTYLARYIEWVVLAPGAGPIFVVTNIDPVRVQGNESANQIIAGAGADTLWGGEGNDRIQGRDGTDHLFGEGGIDALFGGTGADILDGGTARDTLQGQDGNDTLLGGTDSIQDVLFGGNGDDWLDGGLGLDFMYGGLGNDVFVASQQAEGIFEGPGQGIDRIIARGAGAFALPVNVEQLDLDGPDRGIGNPLSNRITGSARNETLFGRAGNDTLVGGGGADTLHGEDGRDSFQFAPGSGADAVRDYVAGFDRLLLQGFGFANAAAVLAATRAVPGGVVIDLAPGDTVFLAGITKPTLSAADFVFLA
jgi:Ca2+-binding RTX toxin-like protein